ncbi:MAG TPA: hypothetical protein VH054_03455 [Polyangiaceae bacterium]|nr:hypothetical protein [Polyangiaceae bacterium]
MTYKLLRTLIAGLFATLVVAAGCGRSDLTVYTFGDGSVADVQNDGGACNATTCPTGCCDASGVCRDGTELNTCGFGAATCNDCQAEHFDFCDSQAHACGNVQPTCDVTSCPSGCCTLFNGQQACVSGVSSLACGSGGQECSDCTTNGQVCDPTKQACVNAPCGPNNCKGCCNGTTCVGAESDTQCGTGGLSCTDCTQQKELCNTSTGQCTTTPPQCTPQNCKNGCCSGDTCVTSEADTQCGVGGGACTDCTQKTETCNAGTCTAACNPQTCVGCCQTGTCFAGFVDSRCGSAGASCVDCTQQKSTCDTLATPRVCKTQQTTCPAAYTSCPSSVTTPVLSPNKSQCSASDLQDAKAACTLGFASASCQLFFQTEPQINKACATCLAPFEFALTDGTGIFNCVSPFVASNCNHDTGCISDCETTSCDQCPSNAVQQCEAQVAQGQCATYVQGASCVGTALFGNGSFCNPQTYQGNYGSWLAGVGAHYCE